MSYEYSLISGTPTPRLTWSSETGHEATEADVTCSQDGQVRITSINLVHYPQQLALLFVAVETHSHKI